MPIEQSKCEHVFFDNKVFCQNCGKSREEAIYHTPASPKHHPDCALNQHDNVLKGNSCDCGTTPAYLTPSASGFPQMTTSSTVIMDCGNPNCECRTPASPKSADWEREVDDLPYDIHCKNAVNKAWLKSFITSLLLQQEQKFVEEKRGMIEEAANILDAEVSYMASMGYLNRFKKKLSDKFLP